MKVKITGYETFLHRARQEDGSTGTRNFNRGVTFLIDKLKEKDINVELK